jgi:hypothetical protein
MLQQADGLGRALGEAHRRYTNFINARGRWTGHLVQSRFASVAMDEAHLMAAVCFPRQWLFSSGGDSPCDNPEQLRAPQKQRQHVSLCAALAMKSTFPSTNPPALPLVNHKDIDTRSYVRAVMAMLAERHRLSAMFVSGEAPCVFL